MALLTKLFKKEKELDFINDRRFSKRYDMLLKLNYYDPVTKSKGISLTKNISKSGVRFPVDVKFPKNTMLDLKIEDPNSQRSISSKAKVIWTEEFVFGDNAENTRYEIGVKLINSRIF
jgi:hypothetical protein